jgi:hypothetical protein
VYDAFLMEFGRQASRGPNVAASTHRCPQCRERALMLQRRHVSPAHLGEPLVTEYYNCDYCDARYKYSPAEDRWRPIS